MPGTALEAARRATASGGVPLSRTTRDDFEPRFGVDLGSIRIHADGEAQRAAVGISAQAYALGNHIAFAPGAPSPAFGRGRELLAHELAHVVLSRPGDAPVIHRRPATKLEPPREKPQLVAIEAKLGEKVATATLSDDTTITLTLIKNEAPPGTYELLKDQPETDYRWATPVVDPDNPTRTAAFRWWVPYLPGTKERRYTDAPSITVTISLTAVQRIERLPGHIRKALTTDEGSLGNEVEIEEVALAGELMAEAGVTAQEMILYDEQIKAAKFSGETISEASVLDFAQSFIGRRRAEEQQSAEQLGDVVMFARLLDNEPLHMLGHGLLGSVLDPGSYKVELSLALGIFKAYREQNRVADFAALDTPGKNRYLHDLVVGFKTLLLRFERALLTDLRAHGNRALDAAEASILLMDRSFTGIWQDLVPAPAWLGREVERINQSEPIVRATDEHVAARAAVDAEEIIDRKRLDRESGILGPSLRDIVAFAEREEKRDARLAQAEAAFEDAVRKNSSLTLPAGSSARNILEAKDGHAAVNLLKHYLVDGRQMVRAARDKIKEDKVLYAADVWIKDEQDRLKGLLGANLGSRIATLIDQFARLRRSQTTFWEDLVHIVEFVSMFVPGPIGWGLRAASAVAGADLVLSKQYAQRALYVAGGSKVDASSTTTALAVLNVPLNMLPGASKATSAPRLGLNALERTAASSADDATRLAAQGMDDAAKVGTHAGSGGAGASTKAVDEGAARVDNAAGRLDDPAPAAPKRTDEPTPTRADEPTPTRADEPTPTRTDEPTPKRTDEPAPAAPPPSAALDDAVRAETALKEQSKKRIDELGVERAALEPKIAELQRQEAVYREVAVKIRREISAIKRSGRPTQEAERLLDMLATRADRVDIAKAKRVGTREADIQAAILERKLRESERIAKDYADQAAVPRARVATINREIDKLSGIALLPERAGGSYRRVSDKTADGVSEANHLPAWDSYQGRVNLSHGDGPSIFMLEADHRRLASTGSGTKAVEWRETQRKLISEGKFSEAFEMDVADIASKFPDGRYKKAIEQARMYMRGLDPTKLTPIK